MISFKDIQIKYDDFTAINNLNLDIKEGEFFTLLGPSGCGKTTTLRSLVGFKEVAAGKITIGERDVTHLPTEKREIGIVFQSYALFPSMTVYENIAFGLKLKKLSREDIDNRVKEVAKKVHLHEDKLHNNISNLSGGQQQRVAIARALVLEPKILCLDEPLSNLDAKLRGDLRIELKRLQKELGLTIIYVTHDQEEALTLSDRIAVFNHGHIEQIGNPMEIYNHSETEFVCNFIGNINPLPRNITESFNWLDSNKKSYVRLEKISTNPTSNTQVEFSGRIVDIEFNGIYTVYTYEVGNQQIRSIEKNDSLEKFYNIGDSVKIYIDSKDIMQYGDIDG